MSYLTYEEYKPEIDSDGDVRFKRDGNVYYIDVNERDPEFFRIVLANIWPIESDKERSQVLMAASDANAISKVSKVFTVENDVWVSIDLFVRRPEDFKDVFTRSMSALDNGVRNFAKRMKEQRMKEQ
ncbi:T3SS (YopN, CesT) and YbjN peptide-binding chaperone 1 [Aeromonas veronii]